MKPRLALGCLLALLLALFLGGAAQNKSADVPDSLHVVRMEQFSEYHVAPLDVVIRNIAQVQKLYRSIYELKPAPSGISSCSNDIGLTYQLDFLHGDTVIQQIEFDPMGCEFLHIDTQDVRSTNSAFDTLLTQILHLPSLIPPGVLPNSNPMPG